MRKSRSLVKWAAAAMAVGAFWMYGAGVQGIDLPVQMGGDFRADIITIDTMKQFRVLERPPVDFLHSRHTEAVAEKGKDCQVCHLMTEDRLSLKFKRTADTSRQAVMDVYHLNCISCHKEQAASNEKSGPVECGECHIDKSLKSNRVPMAFDKSLHYRHAAAQDSKCEKCHHEYDAKAKKLVYAKGKEGSCRYCHKQETEENRIGMREAYHIECIDCHRKTAAQKKKTGPTDCLSCHAPEKRQMIEKVQDVPRMKRDQPDIVYVRPAAVDEKDGNPGSPMNRLVGVPFNHKAHEQYNDSCVVCHHADLAKCNTCHTQTGDKKGENITAGQAMHKLNTLQSCIGCHEAKQAESRCAGCHGSMEKARKKSEASCKTCHMTPPTENPYMTGPDAGKKMAALLLESREAVTGTYDSADIPENVVIKGLADQYDAVNMPHRKIINALVENIKDDNIARYFHLEKGTVCQGCHHNSPASKKPPRCGSCHGKPFDEKDLFKPGIMAAYHRQCMECHETMGIAKPDSRDCTACHIKKKAW